MRKTTAGLLSLALASGLGAALSVPSAAAPPDGSQASELQTAAPSDELPNLLADKQNELREEAIGKVLSGELVPQEINGTTVVKVGEAEASASEAKKADKSARKAAAEGTVDQYVPLENEGTDKVFVFLVEFGDQRAPAFPDQDTDPLTVGPGEFAGPAFNEIPAPDPAVDNSTQWDDNYDRAYYEDLYFGDGSVTGTESLRQYYETQSSGRYSIEGEVSEIVRVPFNQARYGRSGDDPEDENGDDPAVCADIVCENTWVLLRDGLNQWYADQLAAGQTPEQIAATLAGFDQEDRYDFDGDGNFTEGDGYLDRFQIVHAGGDEANGDPIYGEDAIWSHRWYAYGTDFGDTGPQFNEAGGTEIGDSGIWVGDYTIQPENGGLSVVAHEYGHDLGLPDHYDTAAGGDNPVSWWTLMAQSRVSAPGDQGIGTRAADLSAWDKLQLGWLDYEVVAPGQRKTLELGPHEYNTEKAQGVVAVLPDKPVEIPYGAPFAGEAQFYSGAGNNLNSTMTTSFDLTGVSSASMTFKGRWDIESGYDYVYAQASFDGGTTWTALDGTVNGAPFIRDASGTPAISGVQAAWADVVVPMDAAAGQQVTFRFLYRTDGGVTGIAAGVPDGFFADEILITGDGETILADGAETGGEAWSFAGGFGVVGASATRLYDHFYIASNREYVAFDQYLKTGPYNFSFPDRPDFVEHFPYQDGLLISYWDTSYRDNNTSQHPGAGLVLPIDAHPETIYNLEGVPWRGRIQTYDAPFGLERADSFSLTLDGRPNYIRGQRGNPVFNDSDTERYFNPDLPRVGVRVAGTGTRIRVLGENGTSVRIRVNIPAPAPAS